MFFTTKVANNFVRERFETKNRQHSLTKHGSVIINLQQNNADYEHCAHLVSKSAKILPTLKNHSAMCAEAKREIEWYLLKNTIFSTVDVRVCDVERRGKEIIADSLRYTFKIDNIFNIGDRHLASTNDYDSMVFAQELERIRLNHRNRISVETVINPASLIVKVKFPSVKIVLGMRDKNGDDTDTIEFLKQWTGYKTIDVLFEKDDELTLKFVTPLFLAEEVPVDYEKMVNDAGIVKPSIPSIEITDDNTYNFASVPFMKLCDSEELEKLYGVKDMDLDFKIKFQPVFDYIDGCLRTKERVITGTSEDSPTVSVIVPFEMFPYIREDSIVDKIKLLYEKEGDNRVSVTYCDTANLVIFTFLL